MRKHYDFCNARKNPYASQLKKPVTIRLDEGSISYFKGMAEETGIPYQSLINLYLKDCAVNDGQDPRLFAGEDAVLQRGLVGNLTG